FTTAGSVTLKGSSSTSDEGHRIVAFEVVDTGIGIAEDQYDRLFGKFVQADGSATRKFGGTGLGVSLSRKLARSLGGDVVLKKSHPNVGSTFLFTFEDRPEMLSRATEPSTATPSIPSPHSLDGKKVLIVD